MSFYFVMSLFFLNNRGRKGMQRTLMTYIQSLLYIEKKQNCDFTTVGLFCVCACLDLDEESYCSTRLAIAIDHRSNLKTINACHVLRLL